MKKIYLLLAAFISVAFSACTDFLEKTPDEDLTLDQVFAQESYAQEFLNGLYTNFAAEWNFSHESGCFAGAADELEITWTYPYCNNLNSGSWNPTNITDTHWTTYWEAIRKANLFLERIGDTPMNISKKDAWMGEAYFIRAFFHFRLLRLYGAIPIADHAYSSDESFEFVRSPFDKCVNFIVADCNRVLGTEAAMKQESANVGRVTKAAALALKSRVLLYAASDLFNGNTDYANFVNAEGENLIPQTKNIELWDVAAKAALDCIETSEKNGYALYNDGNPLTSYRDIFLKHWNSEILFAQNLGTNECWLHESYLAPNGMKGWSGYCPPQEFIDSYQMANGESPVLGYNYDSNGLPTPIINTASGYEEEGYIAGAGTYWPSQVRKMYANREPRFYASINYAGATWRGRRLEFWSSGKDGGGSNTVDYTKTGYLSKKGSDENVNLLAGTGYTNHTWILFRLAEQYLNFAEAANEFGGPTASYNGKDAYWAINTIRNRAGLPDLKAGLNQDEMREAIRHERKIELAFECHRYFDCRRWKISEKTDNATIYGLNITKGTSLKDDVFYKRTKIETRVFEKKHYLWPIPQDEINKCQTLIQSPFWDQADEE